MTDENVNQIRMLEGGGISFCPFAEHAKKLYEISAKNEFYDRIMDGGSKFQLCSICEKPIEGYTYCNSCWFYCPTHEIIIRKQTFSQEFLNSGVEWTCSACDWEFYDLMEMKEPEE